MWKTFKHTIFGEHDFVQIAEGKEKSGGLFFGGSFHWTRYECSICHEVSQAITESFNLTKKQ